MEIQLDFEHNEIYECGAALLSMLASPAHSNDDQRAEHFTSLCGKAIWIKYLSAPDDMTSVPVKLPYALRDPKRIDRDVNFVARRLGERMVAGRIAAPFLRPERGDELLLPRGIERLSVNQMAEYVLEDAGQADAGNVKKRVWGPSRPVIHLAAAAAFLGQKLNEAGGTPFLELFLLSQEWIEAVVRHGEVFERLLASNPKFPMRHEQLIHVRLA